MKKKLIILITIIAVILLSAFGITYNVKSHSSNNREKYEDENYVKCKVVKTKRKHYCITKYLEFYDTKIHLRKAVIIPTTSNRKIEFRYLEPKTLIYIRQQVLKQALENSRFLFDKQKQELTQTIIQNQYIITTKIDSISIAEDIAQIVNTRDYISKASKVKNLKEKDIKKLPLKILKHENLPPRYAAFYSDGTINYYNEIGKIILKEYRIKNKPFRYQIYDEEGNFYTYNKDKKLVEYSDHLNVLDGKGNFIYYASAAKKDFPTIKRKPKHSDKREKFYKELSNPKSEIYNSIAKAIDAHYNNGSYEEMIEALNEYFTNLEKKNPNLYKKYKQLIGRLTITINFGKYKDKYIFSFNNINVKNNDIIVAAMADSLNLYHGKCAEPNLKAAAGNKLLGKYMYDIKFNLRRKQIVVAEHAPCTTDSRNMSLWGWKYPKTTKIYLKK